MKKCIVIILFLVICISDYNFHFCEAKVINTKKTEEDKIIVASEVVVGKDGWLFYDPHNNNDDIRADYLGTNLFTNEQLNYYLDKLLVIKAKLAVKGIDFCIFLAPNKNRIYSEYYPDYLGEMNFNYRLKQFADFITMNSDIIVVYPYDEMFYTKEHLPSKILYHKYDTHWNALGGYVGAYSLLKVLGIDIPNIHNISINEIDGKYYDLLNINGKSNKNYKDIDYYITYEKEPDSSSYVFKDDSIAAYASNTPVNDKRILMCIDSYFAAMSRPMSSVCNNIVSIMFPDFEEHYIDEYKPDVFVVEILERTLKNRLDHLVSILGN